MFGRFMNNYYYGKSGKGDFGKDDLPANRWQLFWEMLRVRFAALFRLNLIAAAAWIPVLYVLSALLFGLMLPAMEAEAGGVPPEGFDPESHILGSLLLLIPAVTVTGPFSAALAYVTRNWARDEHAFVWSDFKDAFLANWKQALGISFITGLMPALLYVGWRFYGRLAGQNLLFMLPQMLLPAAGLVWSLATVFAYPMLVTYRMGFRTVLRNSLLLALGRLPHVLGIRLAALIPTLLAAAVTVLSPYGLQAMLALAGYYVLLGNALSRFLFASFTNGVFDRFINARIENARVNRGLAPREEEEDGGEDGEGG